MRRITITYDVVTPESAADGDFAESGWENEEGIEIAPDADDIEEHDGDETAAIVSAALEAIGRGGKEPSCYPRWQRGTWYTDADPDIDYSTGAEKRLSYHLNDFTPEEEEAIYRAIVGR